MSLMLQLTGDGGSVRLTVHGRERKHFEDISDANWLTVDVSVKAAGCSAEVGGSMRSSDFSLLARQLGSIVTHEAMNASLRTMEEWVELDIGRKRNGAVAVSGKVRVFGTPGASLEFQFETDFSALEKFTQASDLCLRTYPVIEG